MRLGIQTGNINLRIISMSMFFKASKFYFFVSQSELGFYGLSRPLKLSPKTVSLFQSVRQTNQLTSFPNPSPQIHTFLTVIADFSRAEELYNTSEDFYYKKIRTHKGK